MLTCVLLLQQCSAICCNQSLGGMFAIIVHCLTWSRCCRPFDRRLQSSEQHSVLVRWCCPSGCFQVLLLVFGVVAERPKVWCPAVSLSVRCMVLHMAVPSLLFPCFLNLRGVHGVLYRATLLVVEVPQWYHSHPATHCEAIISDGSSGNLQVVRVGFLAHSDAFRLFSVFLSAYISSHFGVPSEIYMHC